MFDKIKKIKRFFQATKEKVQAKARSLVCAVRMSSLRLVSDCRGDGSMNFLITVVISVAIAAILIGVISAAIPGFWETVQNRITGLLGA